MKLRHMTAEVVELEGVVIEEKKIVTARKSIMSMTV